jgi:hypothetical protein
MIFTCGLVTSTACAIAMLQRHPAGPCSTTNELQRKFLAVFHSLHVLCSSPVDLSIVPMKFCKHSSKLITSLSLFTCGFVTTNARTSSPNGSSAALRPASSHSTPAMNSTTCSSRAAAAKTLQPQQLSSIITQHTSDEQHHLQQQQQQWQQQQQQKLFSRNG